MKRNNKRWLCGWLMFCLLLGLLSVSLAEDVQFELSEVNDGSEEIQIEAEEDITIEQDGIIEDVEDSLLDIDGEIVLDGLNDELGGLLIDAKESTDAMVLANGSYTINGKTVYATMVEDPGNGQCWAYANSIYSIIWGVNFDSTFAGSSGTGNNMLLNLSDADRTLTATHLKNYIGQASLGAVIRIGGCTSSCPQFNNDGLKCGHSGHSLVLVAKNENGFTTFERLTGPGRREKSWTWDSFCNAYSGYPYIKYIKWPNAPAYGGTQPVVTASTLQFTNVTYPKTFRINTSAGWALGGGTVESNYDLKSLKTQILNSSGSVISSATVSISGKSYAIRNLDTYSSSDNGVKFSYIKSAGNYKWVLTATDSNGRSLTLEMPFTAVSSGSTVTSTASILWDKNDTSSPTISDVKVTNLTIDGYTVSCTVNDNVGVTSVKFPTWTEQNGQDDLIWHEGQISGNTASFQVKVGDHKNERGCKYITHIYAYDAAGNNAKYDVNVDVPAPDTSAPTISNAKVTNLTSEGYTVTCTVSDNVGVTKVQFPTWTEGQTTQDAIWHDGTISGNTATCQIRVSDHGNKTGMYYHTDIHAWDAAGNVSTGAKVRNNYVPVPTVEVAGVSLDKSELSLTVGESAAIVATVEPEDATDKRVTWSSSNASVATVSDGTIYAKGVGTATITVTTVNGKTASCTVSVKEDLNPTNISLDTTEAAMNVGQTMRLYATLTPSNAVTTLDWESSDESVAFVDSNGIVAAVDEGAANITVSTGNGLSATCRVTVEASTIAPTSIELNKTKATVVVGGTVKLTAKLAPSDAETTLTWTSSNANVAIVSNKGVVKARAKGTATITVTTDNGKTASCLITVPKAPKKVKFKKSTYTVKKGKTIKLVPVLTPSGAKTTYKWSSSNKKIATVSSKGVVKGIKKGTAKITVKTANGKSITVKVMVK